MRLANGTEITYTDRYRSKFGDALAEYAYERNLDGALDTIEDVGDGDWGWYGRVSPTKILANDTQGFVDLWRYETAVACDAHWSLLVDEYEQFMGDDDE